MDSLQRWLALVGLLSAALAGLVYLIRTVWAGFKVMDALRSMVEHELTPNHGSSMKDDLAAVAVNVGKLQAQVQDLVTAKKLAHELLQMQLDELRLELEPRHRKDTPP